MASNSDWFRKLSNHQIFEQLRKHEELWSKSAGSSYNTRVKAKSSADRAVRKYGSTDGQSLMIERDGEIFLWDFYTLSVLTTNLKTLAFGDTEQSNDFVDRVQYQELTCTNTPGYRVESLELNVAGTQLALIGQGGLVVLEIPEHRGKFGLIGDGKQKILCRTTSIDERFFLTSGRRLLQAMWHPGSSTQSQLIVLTSDNTIRIYDIFNPEVAEQILPIDYASDNSTSLDLGSSPDLNTLGALGEVAVSFDLGPPVTVDRFVPARDNRTESAVGSVSSVVRTDVVWPVYLLMGNGEVYRLLTAINTTLPIRQRVSGPLHMYPAAEDNYGTDACSIACLPTQPPLIVIATCDGKLYHCVLLGRGAEDTTEQTLNRSGGDVDGCLRGIPEQSLFVYETVELELSLTTISVETEEPIIDDFSCPIKIHRDPLCPERYHCIHAAGMHSIALPWVKSFQRFLESEEELNLAGISSEQRDSIVEHLVCTKPLPSSPPSPMLGVCLVTSRLLGSKIICLTATLQCIVLPLRYSCETTSVPLLSNDSQSLTSPLRHLHKEPFDVHIQKILQRTSSNPILRASFSSDLTPQECFQLLSRVTQVYRDEYILKQDHAREDIEQKIRVLKDLKTQQLDELKNLQLTKQVLHRGTETLAQKYDNALKGQLAITTRVNSLLKSVQEQMPMLSDAEKDLQKELKNLQETCRTYETRLQQLNDKKNYNDRAIERNDCQRKPSLGDSRLVSTNHSSADLQRMKTILTQEGQEIAALVHQLGSIRVNIGT